MRERSSLGFRIALWWIGICQVTCVYLAVPTRSASEVALHYSAPRTWTDGTHDLIERAHRLSNVGQLGPLAPARASGEEQHPLVGDQREFFATDFARGGSPYFTDATCRAVGTFCYIFVEDEQWGRGTVTHDDVVNLGVAFDESTPRDPSKGIYTIETTDLGPPPDEIDLDPKIYILVLDIPDNYKGTGSYIAGYFEPINQRRGVFRDPNTGMKLSSNEVEMIYLDADPLDSGSLISREVLAHELQHLIHWRHDPNEDLWVNEGCSDYAALFLCGYGHDQSWHVAAFEREPQVSLVYWPRGMSSSLANYGAAYLWMVYLHENYGGVSTISSLIADPTDGISSIDSVLSARGYSQNFGDVFSDWKLANYLDDTFFASGKYGYRNLDLTIERGRRHFSFPVPNTLRQIQSWAGDYIEFTGGDRISDLQIDFAGRNPAHDFDVRAIAMKGGEPVAVEKVQIEEDTGNGHISFPDFGHTVDTVVLVTNWRPRTEADFAESVSYSYSARLGAELDFDVAVLPNAVNPRYVDIVVRLDAGDDKSLLEDMDIGVPRISVTRLGKALVSEHNMVPIFGDAYVHQLYVPHGWSGSEIKWDISYLGRAASRGDLGSIN